MLFHSYNQALLDSVQNFNFWSKGKLLKTYQSQIFNIRSVALKIVF